jgi:excisionase family DNA binding protein
MTTDTSERFREEISTVAAAEKYSLTPSYVARLARTHVIRARKFGRDWIIDEEALRAYLALPRRTGPKQHVQG